MPVHNAVVDATIERRLGKGLVEQLLSSMWSVDCQTCGRSLSRGKTAVYVVDMQTFAVASLHHQTCQRSAWSDSGMASGLGGHNLSWTSMAVGLPGNWGATTGVDVKPALLVNPGLEQVVLDRTPPGSLAARRRQAF